MSISRRHFIVGTAAGLILPSYYDKALAYLENHDEPLIEIPRQVHTDLFAVGQGAGNGFQLNLGDPWAGPPVMTIREFAVEHCGSEEAYQEEWCDGEEVDFDDFVAPEIVVDFWARTDSPNARAYRLLKRLDLGPELTGEDAVGEIRFIDGPCPGNDYLGAHAPSQLDISLLQQRLNDLNTGIRISMA
jgi:hypothetical protein